MNVKHTQDDIGSNGCLGLQYFYDGAPYVQQLDPSHPWFTGEEYRPSYPGPNIDYELIGWFPGNGSINLARMLREQQLGISTTDGIMPTENKRRIRIE